MFDTFIKKLMSNIWVCGNLISFLELEDFDREFPFCLFFYLEKKIKLLQTQILLFNFVMKVSNTKINLSRILN